MVPSPREFSNPTPPSNSLSTPPRILSRILESCPPVEFSVEFSNPTPPRILSPRILSRILANPTPPSNFSNLGNFTESWGPSWLRAGPPHWIWSRYGAVSNITYSSLLTLTVVQKLVRSNQLKVSHFVIQHQLLPLRRPETPCRPSKGVPSEHLRLVEVINFA